MPISERFKPTDLTEQKMEASASPAFDLTESALDQFYAEGADSDAFVLMLYDEGRMPYSQRIERDVFVQFFSELSKNFPFVGNFESYLFILRQIFGESATILFEVPGPGKLNISVNAASDVEYGAIVRELSPPSTYSYFTLATSDGDDFIFRGVAGIETEYELGLLFAEIMPAGIFPGIALEFFSLSVFIGEDGSGEFDIVDSELNQIVFIEIGG